MPPCPNFWSAAAKSSSRQGSRYVDTPQRPLHSGTTGHLPVVQGGAPRVFLPGRRASLLGRRYTPPGGCGSS